MNIGFSIFKENLCYLHTLTFCTKDESKTSILLSVPHRKETRIMDTNTSKIYKYFRGKFYGVPYME